MWQEPDQGQTLHTEKSRETSGRNTRSPLAYSTSGGGGQVIQHQAHEGVVARRTCARLYTFAACSVTATGSSVRNIVGKASAKLLRTAVLVHKYIHARTYAYRHAHAQRLGVLTTQKANASSCDSTARTKATGAICASSKLCEQELTNSRSGVHNTRK